MKVSVEANKWMRESKLALPERMPRVDKLYLAGARYVWVDEYSEITGRMVLGITFPADLAKADDLWLCVANCQHDGVKRIDPEKLSGPTRIKMLRLGSEDYKYKIENGPYGGLTEW